MDQVSRPDFSSERACCNEDRWADKPLIVHCTVAVWVSSDPERKFLYGGQKCCPDGCDVSALAGATRFAELIKRLGNLLKHQKRKES
jgi:hypothetical protein